MGIGVVLVVAVSLAVPSPLHDDLLHCSRRARAVVEAGDKAGWLAMHHADGVVEDPVGSTLAATPRERAMFWNAFIAGKTIEFSASHEVVDTHHRTVVALLESITTLASGARARLPLAAQYVFTQVPAADDTACRGLQLVHIRHFWDASESEAVITHLPRDIIPSAAGSLSVLKQIYDVHGVAYVLGMLLAMTVGNVGPTGRARVEQLTTRPAPPHVEDLTVRYPLTNETVPYAEGSLSHLRFVDLHASGVYVAFRVAGAAASTTPGGSETLGVGWAHFARPSEQVVDELVLYMA